MILSGQERDGDRLRELRRAVRVDDFFQADHAIYFEVMADLIDRGKPIDAMIVREELIRRQQFDTPGGVGGLEYMTQIVTAAPNYANGLAYADVIREKSNWRRIIAAGNDIIRKAYAASKHDKSLETARAAADVLSGISLEQSKDNVVRLGEAARKVLGRRDNPQVRRIPTHIHALDNLIGGVPKGKMMLVGSDPRVGKSTFKKQILGNQARAGVNVGLVTIEEDQEKVAENGLAGEGWVANHAIAQGRLDAADWDRIGQAADRLDRLPFFIDDRASTLDEVIASIERLALKHKCEVIAVDHLHLIRVGAETREQEVSRISGALKSTFKRLNVAGMVAVQLNRGVDVKEKPTLRSLRGSGSLEADGDIIALLYREDVWRYQEPGYVPTFILEVNVAKNKDGCMGEFPLTFNGDYQTITDIDPFA